MSKKDCIKDQELILHYYGEPVSDDLQQHLTACPACQERLASLGRDLDRLPSDNYQPDDLLGIRMAARVTEKIRQPRRRLWLPTLGATAAAALALVITLSGSPPPEVTQIVKSQPVVKIQPTAAAIEPYETMPDIEFLEDIELLQELDLLAQLEGV